jgi:hypothetical protein
MRFRGYHGYHRGPTALAVRHRGPSGRQGGRGMTEPFGRRFRPRYDYAKWLRRYKEDLEDELREVTSELQRLEQEQAGEAKTD